jgi:hypothetical protein
VKASVFVFCLSLLLVGVAPAADSLKVRTVGHCDTPGTANGVAASGDSAYVAADTSGLRIISVVDPAHPVEVGHYDTPGEAWGVAVSGHFAYVADGDSGLRVVSVADPAHPAEVGKCATSGYTEGVAVSGKCAYVADGDSGLRVISIADPAHPAQVGHCATPAFAHGVIVRLDSGLCRGWRLRIADYLGHGLNTSRPGRILRQAGVCLWRGPEQGLRSCRGLRCRATSIPVLRPWDTASSKRRSASDEHWLEHCARSAVLGGSPKPRAASRKLAGRKWPKGTRPAGGHK